MFHEGNMYFEANVFSPHWFNFSCMSQKGVKSHKRSQAQWGGDRSSRTHSSRVVACLIFYRKKQCCSDFKGNSGRGKQCHSLGMAPLGVNSTKYKSASINWFHRWFVKSSFLPVFNWVPLDTSKLTSPHLSALLWRPRREFFLLLLWRLNIVHDVKYSAVEWLTKNYLVTEFKESVLFLYL